MLRLFAALLIYRFASRGSSLKSKEDAIRYKLRVAWERYAEEHELSERNRFDIRNFFLRLIDRKAFFIHTNQAFGMQIEQSNPCLCPDDLTTVCSSQNIVTIMVLAGTFPLAQVVMCRFSPFSGRRMIFTLHSVKIHEIPFLFASAMLSAALSE